MPEHTRPNLKDSVWVPAKHTRSKYCMVKHSLFFLEFWRILYCRANKYSFDINLEPDYQRGRCRICPPP